MRTLLLVAATALSVPAYTQSSPPAAPSVTAGAQTKGFRFDWEPVPGAGWYKFEYRAHRTGAFVQLGANYSASTTNIRLRLPLHLFDWTWARYRIAACNSAGCTPSNEVSVDALRRDSVGYFKASDAQANMEFGTDTDVSPDGLNFVVASPGNYSGTVGDGAIYVFRRASNGTWAQRARLMAPPQPSDQGGREMKVSISADGNTVVLGMRQYYSEDNDLQSGEAFVFRFDGTAWVRTKLYSSQRGGFGRWVGINDAGDTIAVATGNTSSAATPKRIFIYRLTNGTWTPVRGISEASGEGCYLGVFSRDGSTVAEQCSTWPDNRPFVRLHSGANWSVREELPIEWNVSGDIGTNGFAISGDGNTVAAQIYRFTGPDANFGPAEVQVFHRDGAWSKVATLVPGPWRSDSNKDSFGQSVAVSGDGSTIAVGDVFDNGLGTGPRAAPLNPGTRATGAVYIYRLKNSWVLANMVKPNRSTTDFSFFGQEVALNGNGQTLLVGDGTECSGSRGIGGDWSTCTQDGRRSGAVFLY